MTFSRGGRRFVAVDPQSPPSRRVAMSSPFRSSRQRALLAVTCVTRPLRFSRIACPSGLSCAGPDFSSPPAERYRTSPVAVGAVSWRPSAATRPVAVGISGGWSLGGEDRHDDGQELLRRPPRLSPTGCLRGGRTVRDALADRAVAQRVDEWCVGRWESVGCSGEARPDHRCGGVRLHSPLGSDGGGSEHCVSQRLVTQRRGQVVISLQNAQVNRPSSRPERSL